VLASAWRRKALCDEGWHEVLNCGLLMTGLMNVPAKREVSGVPYSATPPKLCFVWPGMTFPKFHTQPDGLFPSVQNG